MPHKDPVEYKAYQTAYNKTDRAKALAVIRANKHRAVRQAIVDAAKSKPCADCGNQYPACAMDLHHIDPTTKDSSVSRLIRSGANLQDEIDKCIVLCAVCHRLRHYKHSIRDSNPAL